MASLIGEYTCAVDEKGRIILPAPLKKQISAEAEEKFMINRGFEKYLALYPRNEWNIMNEKIRKLNLFVEKNRLFVRYFYRGATELTLDKTNRLLLPKSLSGHAKIGKEVILLGMIDHIEIWSKEAYETSMATEPEDFATLAEEVMGKQE
ncbi:MAG: division/cell wall cluster transcriptional repressor MraZ [Bacteroidetes bacterium]|nr:division/cell wall cluster transcriptional repressor MraZ [Bacteroidota bacterium]